MSTIAKKIGSSFDKQWVMVLILGALEVVLSQIPNLEVRGAAPAAGPTACNPRRLRLALPACLS